MNANSERHTPDKPRNYTNSNMTTGAITLMAWLHQSMSKGPSMANMATSGLSTMKRRDVP